MNESITTLLQIAGWLKKACFAFFGSPAMMGFLLFCVVVLLLARPAQTHINMPVSVEPAVWVVHDTITLSPTLHNYNSEVSILYNYE